MSAKTKQDLNDLAGALRITATEVERIGKEVAELPRVDAQRAIRRFAPPACYTSVTVHAAEIGRASFDLRSYLAKSAGQQLGHFIAEKTDFQMMDRTPPEWRDPRSLLYQPEHVRFEAQIIPFTRAELERFVRDVVALAQGRIC